MDPLRLLSRSLIAHPNGAGVSRVLAAALEAVDPYQAVMNRLALRGNRLWIDGHEYNLEQIKHIYLTGAGKAAYPMAQAAVDLLGERITGGLLITKSGHAPSLDLPGKVRIREAGHPIPDIRGENAAGEMADLIEKAGPDDLVLCLISGGGSALMPAPAQPITLAELQQTTTNLLACGADITQINTLRKHIDRLKGGGLARLAAPAALAALILSDVVGDPTDSIASGPTVPDPTTFVDALAVVAAYELRPLLPESVLTRLEAGRAGLIPETPKPGDTLFDRVQTTVIGSNAVAARAALEQARREGWNALLLTTALQGEARQAGRFLAALARQVHASGEPLHQPACIILGGETTVTLSGSGLGGRNQELALGAVRDLSGLPNTFIVALATDGGDGPTDAAGAVASGSTLARATSLGLDLNDFLNRNDAYHFFSPLGDLLRPGPTRTNVNDLYFVFVF